MQDDTCGKASLRAVGIVGELACAAFKAGENLATVHDG